jgi:hypothetical protein
MLVIPFPRHSGDLRVTMYDYDKLNSSMKLTSNAEFHPLSVGYDIRKLTSMATRRSPLRKWGIQVLKFSDGEIPASAGMTG